MGCQVLKPPLLCFHIYLLCFHLFSPCKETPLALLGGGIVGPHPAYVPEHPLGEGPQHLGLESCTHKTARKTPSLNSTRTVEPCMERTYLLPLGDVLGAKRSPLLSGNSLPFPRPSQTWAPPALRGL